MSFFTRSFDDATRAQKGYSDFMEGVRQQNVLEAQKALRNVDPRQVTVPTSATGQIPTTRVITPATSEPEPVMDTAQMFGGATNIGPQTGRAAGLPDPTIAAFGGTGPSKDVQALSQRVYPPGNTGGPPSILRRIEIAKNVAKSRPADSHMFYLPTILEGLANVPGMSADYIVDYLAAGAGGAAKLLDKSGLFTTASGRDARAQAIDEAIAKFQGYTEGDIGTQISDFLKSTFSSDDAATPPPTKTAGLQPPSTPTAPVTPAFTQSQLQTAIAEIESSGGKNTGKNPNSTASGIYQVTNPTATGRQDADLVAFGLTPAANNSNAAKNAYAVRRLDALTKYWTQQATNGVISQNDIPLKIAQSWHQGFTAAKQNKPLDAATQKYVVKFQNAFQRALSGSAANVTPPPPPPPQSQQGSPAGVDTSTIISGTGRTRTLKTAPAQPQAGVAPKGESHVRDAMVAEKPRAPATNNWTVEIYNKELRDGQFAHRQALEMAQLYLMAGDDANYFKARRAADQAGHTIENIAINKAINSFEISSDPRMLMAIANTRNPEKQLVIRPRSDGNFDIEENGSIVKENQKRSEIVSLFRREASQAYNTAIKTAAVERESARQEKKWEAQIEAMKQAWQTNRELAKEQISKKYGKMIKADSGGVFVRVGNTFRHLTEKDFPGIDGGEPITRTVAELVPRENVGMTLSSTKAAAYGED